jgi:hypothetical protein
MINTKTIKQVLIISFLCCVSFLSALDLSVERIAIHIDEKSGRLSLYQVIDPEKNRSTALFSDLEPRTSHLSVKINDKVYRLGDSFGFKTSVSAGEERAIIRYDSKDLILAQHLSFIKTRGSEVVDALRIDIECINISESEVLLSLRYLFDTYLGERAAVHFSTNRKDIISEYLLVPSREDDVFWVSKNERIGLMGSVRIQGIIPPTSIHFANWKRLNDSAWGLIENRQRNYSNLPYSVNDSAIAYFFDDLRIPRGGSITVTILLGIENRRGFSPVSQSLEKSVSTQLLEQAGKGLTDLISLEDDMATLQEILYQVNSAIDNGIVLTEAELAAFEALIKQIEERSLLR